MSNSVINIQNPIPILQQPKSFITTNPLIPNQQQEIEYTTIDIKEMEKQNKQYSEIQENGIKYTSFATMHSKISESIVGVLTDLFEKPKGQNTFEHIQYIFTKDQRYAYIGLFLVILSLIIILIRKSI